MRKTAVAALALALVQALGAAPKVSNVTLGQDPSTREVTVTYELASVPAIVTLDVEIRGAGDTWRSIGGENIRQVAGDAFREITEKKDVYSISWRPTDLGLDLSEMRARVRAYDVGNPPDYMVVPLYACASDGTSLAGIRHYPSADFLPGGIGDAAYKTANLVLRRVHAKGVVFTMGSVGEVTDTPNEATHRATLASDYYVGVYPITQYQWRRLMDATPSYWSVDGLMRPVESVSYNDIRTSTANSWTKDYEYPNSPHSGSFLGKLNALTGDALEFDLPSEAQWEYAARAGNGAGYYGRSDCTISQDNAMKIGRMSHNGGQLNWVEPPQAVGPSNATAVVGTYLPNDWGIYDMLGNVGELCLDWYKDDISDLNGAPNMSASTAKVVRGAAYGCVTGYNNMRPAYRSYTKAAVFRERYTGFRVVCKGKISF